MAGELLLDTGALVSLLDRDQRHHHKYADQPMDFADATLVALAEDVNSPLIFTTDRKDFGVYRFKDRKAFEVLPA